MPKLILKRFKCEIDTDEIGGESPYFLTYVGDFATGKADVKLTRQGNWHNEVDQGETWTVNETLFTDFDLAPSKTLVLSVMVEEDEGLDVSSSERGSIKAAMRTATQSLIGTDLGNSFIVNMVKNRFKNAIRNALQSSAGADDDLMSPVRRVTLNGSAGERPVVRFTGDTGRYAVRYAQA